MAKETTEVDTGNQPENNTVINPDAPASTEPPPQTPDQFIGGGEDAVPEPMPPQTPDQFYTAGWTDASRIENSAEQQAAEQEAAEKAAKKKG